MCSGSGVPGISTTLSGKSGISAKLALLPVSRNQFYLTLQTYRHRTAVNATEENYRDARDYNQDRRLWRSGEGAAPPLEAPLSKSRSNCLLVLADPVSEQPGSAVYGEDQEDSYKEAQ